MKLPDKDTKPQDIRPRAEHTVARKTTKAPLVLSIIALCVSLGGALFAGYLYATQPMQISNYVQAHKDELRGEKGDTGAQGAQGMSGRNGTNSYSPTYCTSYSYTYSNMTSTNCY